MVTTDPTLSWSVLILTGGGSRRMGRDKAGVTVAGVPLLDGLLTHLPPEVPVILVGPDPGPLARTVRRTVESPPGGGPVAGIAAGIRLIDTPLVVVSAVDLPFAGPLLARLALDLAAADEGVAGIVPTVAGRPQPLCAAYRTESLQGALVHLGDPRDRAVRELTALLHVRHTVFDAAVLQDVDTPAQLAAARERARWIMAATTEVSMDDWVRAVAERLGVSGDTDIDLILDVAKDAAHQVQRPAAPVTTYLMGLAVGAGMDPNDAAAKIRTMAEAWPDRA